MNKEYRVAVRFDQVQVGHLAIFATNEEEAKTKAIAMMEKHKNPEVLDVVEAPNAPKTLDEQKPNIITE